MYSYSKFEHNYTKSYFKYEEPVSDDYRVFINGEEIPVYTCRISKMPFNRLWPGHQREINQTEMASFVNIVSDEEIELEVIVNKEYEKILIKPYSKEISHTVKGGRVCFKLTENGQFVLSCDNLHNCLYIFNSKPIYAENPDEVTYYFGPGVHFPGKIELHDNESIYADKDALIFGTIFAENASNIRVFGNGLFDGSFEERYSELWYEAYTNGNIRLYDCKNVKIEGVLFKNSALWCVNLFHCFDSEIDNIKVFGQWRYNTDGIDMINSQNIVVKNSFVHSFDDSICIKGIDRYIDTDNKNIVVDNCVLWCDWGKTLEIGLETACREYKNITYRNCDIIRGGNTALDINNGDIAEVSNVLYENINVEYNPFDNVPVLQENDEHQYDEWDKQMVPALIRIGNSRFRCDFYSNIPKEYPPIDLTGIKQATVHDVSYKNIRVYYDEGIPKVDGKYNIPVVVFSCVDGVNHYNINISGITVNGEAISENDIIVKATNVDNLTFDDEFAQLKKNNVPSANQLTTSNCVYFENTGEGKGKVLFVGNSITFHAAKEDIGWNNNWGMAASAKEKDYVHLLAKKFYQEDIASSVCICQVAEWERNYKNGTDTFHNFEAARDFDADVIVFRLLENCPSEAFDVNLFKNQYKELIDYLNKNNRAKIILTTGFWHHPGDKAIDELGRENDYIVVGLGDLGEKDEMKALGLFEHSGVSIHPGDKGMEAIAERVWKAFEKKYS